MREQSCASLEALVDGSLRALTPYLDVPCAFFGHSMGALLAFEIARRLSDPSAGSLRKLFVSGRRAPQLRGTGEKTYDLPDADFIAAVKRLNGTPDELLANAEAMGLMLPFLRADFAVVETYQYRPGPALRIPIAAFGGLEDLPRAELEGWREQTTGEFSLTMFPGDHFFIQSSRVRLLDALAGDLRNERPLRGTGDEHERRQRRQLLR